LSVQVEIESQVNLQLTGKIFSRVRLQLKFAYIKWPIVSKINTDITIFSNFKTTNMLKNY